MAERMRRRPGRGQRAAYLPPRSHNHHHRLLTRGTFTAVVLLLLATGCGYGGWRLYSSGWLIIQKVQVEGASTVSEDDIREAAALRGQQILTVNTSAAAARVNTLAWVQTATVERHFPNSITIRIVERTPIGVWRVGADSYLVDGQGVVIEAATDFGDLPIVDATQSGFDVRPGDHVEADSLRTAQQVRTLASSISGQTIAVFTYDKDNGLTAVTRAGTRVLLGDGQNLDYKLAVWQAIARKVNPGDIHELDLRYGDRPFYR